MNKENIRRRIRNVTAFAAALLLAASFSLPSGTEIMGERVGNAIVASAWEINNEDFEYEVNSDGETVTITGYSGGDSSVTIPDDIKGNTVTAIGDGAFCGCSNLTSITIPNSVTAIGNGAFDNCTNLESITIPNSVTSIGSSAFHGCFNLTSVLFEDNSQLTSIGNTAFADCESLTSITIPAGVTSIESATFFGCRNLESITIPSNVTSIGETAFADCESLTSITIPAGVTSIEVATFNGCRNLESITIPSDVTSIGGFAFAKCESLKTITIPSDVTSIGDGAFVDCTSLTSIFLPDGATVNYGAIPASATQLKYTVDRGGKISITGIALGTDRTSVDIPEAISGKTVTSIGEFAFEDTNLTSVSFADNSQLTLIGDGAFSNCTNLESITIPNSVTYIGSSAFHVCSNLTSVLFEDNSQLIYIESSAFADCESLTSITIPDGVTSIEIDTFNGCRNLESIFLPNDLDVSSARIPSSATQIKYSVIDNSNVIITKVTPGEGVTSVTVPETIDGKTIAVITNNAFSECSNLVRIILPQGVDTSAAGIPENATQIRYSVGEDGNATITKVSLGSGDHDLTMPQNIGDRAVTGFADGALADCPNVEHTHREKTAATCTSQAVCAICEMGYGDMKAHDRESHGMCTVCGDGAEVCGEKAHYVFDNNTGTLTIFGEGSVTKNDWYWNDTTFRDSAKNIVIERGITEFNYISDFRNVESISYPDTITEINFEKISSSKSLTSITIDKDNNNYCAVDNVVFSKDKTKLYYYLSNNPAEKYDIPKGVTSIENSAFYECRNLKNITIPSGVEQIGNKAFGSCSSIENITLPRSVKSVGWDVFYGCDNLEAIFIGGTSVTTAGIPETTTWVYYYTEDSGNVYIGSISLGIGKTSVNIPEILDGSTVVSVSKAYWKIVGEHTHLGGEATCASKAVCALCGNEYGETGAHGLTKHDAVPASCTTDGSIEYYECSECGKLFTDSTGETETTLDKVKITSTGHKFGTAWVSDTKEHYHECTVCHERSDIADHEKDSGTVTKEATPTESGTIEYKCKVCGVKMGEETITVTISSFEVTSSGVIVKYTVIGSTEVKSQTVKFSEVTEEMVELMKSKDIKLVIDFVNYSTSGSDTVILTAAQIKAIEYVLEHDLGISA